MYLTDERNQCRASQTKHSLCCGQRIPLHPEVGVQSLFKQQKKQVLALDLRVFHPACSI